MHLRFHVAIPPKNAKAATLEVAACGIFDVLLFIDCQHQHTNPLRRYSKKVAVGKSVAKSVGVHRRQNINLEYLQMSKISVF